MRGGCIRLVYTFRWTAPQVLLPTRRPGRQVNTEVMQASFHGHGTHVSQKVFNSPHSRTAEVKCHKSSVYCHNRRVYLAPSPRIFVSLSSLPRGSITLLKLTLSKHSPYTVYNFGSRFLAAVLANSDTENHHSTWNTYTFMKYVSGLITGMLGKN